MRFVLVLLLLPCAGLGQGLSGAEAVILRVESESIYAHYFKPRTAGSKAGRHAAIVLVHGFDGVSEAREGFWAHELAALGVATLVIESFSARGAGTTLANQSSVSTAQGVRDASGRFRAFVTDPNELFRLTAAGPSSFEQVYRIVA